MWSREHQVLIWAWLLCVSVLVCMCQLHVHVEPILPSTSQTGLVETVESCLKQSGAGNYLNTTLKGNFRDLIVFSGIRYTHWTIDQSSFICYNEVETFVMLENIFLVSSKGISRSFMNALTFPPQFMTSNNRKFIGRTNYDVTYLGCILLYPQQILSWPVLVTFLTIWTVHIPLTQA